LLIVADVNLDDRPDFISGSSLFLGNGDGTFQPPRDLGAPVLLVADLNGDRKPDLVQSPSPGLLSAALGNGDGTFEPPAAVGSAAIGEGDFCFPSICHHGFSNLVAADFNGDGRLDLAMGSITTTCIDRCDVTATAILTFMGNGDGTFQTGPSFDTDGSVLPVLLMADDFDRDGKADIAASSTILYGSSVIQFYLGQGDGTFPTTADYEVGTGFVNLAAADFNGDKLPDIVSADPNDANISVVLSIAPDFSLIPSSSTLLVSQGGESSETLTVGARAGFSTAVALNCSVAGPAPLPTCIVSPNSVNPEGTAKVTVNTGAAAATLFPRLPFSGLAAVVLAWGIFPRRLLKGRRWTWLFGPLVLGGGMFLVACGGGSSPIQPSTRTYTVTVTGTSNELQHSTKIDVTVK
jgi:FG-GAP-like repeat